MKWNLKKVSSISMGHAHFSSVLRLDHTITRFVPIVGRFDMGIYTALRAVGPTCRSHWPEELKRLKELMEEREQRERKQQLPQ